MSETIPDFKPPEYVVSLIQAINDGAKTAQTGALAVAALGFYLMAVSFSTSDLDLLLDHTTSIAQLGLQVAPQAVFGVAPLVFLALHVFTLLRYDMLAANLHFLNAKLMNLPDDEQECCRQLLANVEFIMGAIAPKTSLLYSWLFRWVWVFLVAVFPVFVFLVVQIFSMRYQSTAIIWAQRFALAADFLMLVWFFWRQNPALRVAEGLQRVDLRNVHKFIWKSKHLWWLPLAILVLSFVWIRVPGNDADIFLFWGGASDAVYSLNTVWQPFDNFLCPKYRWGCRYLEGSNQTLVAQIFPKELEVVNQSKRDEPDEEGLVAGAYLRGRSLRFANLRIADLTNADLSFADLSNANLAFSYLNGADLTEAVGVNTNFWHANLTDAHLDYTVLVHARFPSADLRKAYFDNAVLTSAIFAEANMAGTDLTNADLRRANLIDANLTDATLSDSNLADSVELSQVNLTGADLTRANLAGAYFSNATLINANLTDTQLPHATLLNTNLTSANLLRANLADAFLTGANLAGADLNYANLAGADLSSSLVDGKTNFSNAIYTTYDSKDQCKTLFPIGFGDPIKQHGMSRRDNGEPEAKNAACPYYP